MNLYDFIVLLKICLGNKVSFILRLVIKLIMTLTTWLQKVEHNAASTSVLFSTMPAELPTCCTYLGCATDAKHLPLCCDLGSSVRLS